MRKQAKTHLKPVDFLTFSLQVKLPSDEVDRDSGGVSGHGAQAGRDTEGLIS